MFTYKISDMGEELRVIHVAGCCWSGGGAELALNCLNMRLGGVFEAQPFGYLFHVRRKGVTSRFLLGTFESEVEESALFGPTIKVRSSRENSLMVALSS